jgi:hypothetical protein
MELNLMIRFCPPILRSDFIIVVHREKQDLCAAAISYLFEHGQYIPIFSFTKVDVAANAAKMQPDAFSIQRHRAESFAVFLNNSIIHNGGCENLILLGLTPNQISFLDYLEHYNVLNIDGVEDLGTFLGGFAANKGDAIECSPEQSIHALNIAVSANRKLKIGAHNVDLPEINFALSDGIVIIEDGKTSDIAIAANYALSIGAHINLVKETDEIECAEVLFLLEDWDNGNEAALEHILEIINERIGAIDFANYQFATFFTSGLPYSLSLKNVPISYVHLDNKPDFFIHNAIFYETSKHTGTAVVFSPSFFKDEETNNLIGLLEFKNYYLRKLVGKAADVYNLKSSIELFPFDLLHICSHGGDVDGTRCEVKFKDIEGFEHVIEFDHVLTVALTPYMDKHSVESIYYFKKLDGLVWRSKELKAKNYSHEIYASIISHISNAFDKKRVRRLHKVSRVKNANAIHSSFFNYLANFDQFGNTTCPPLIFNNACFSWINVSTSFLVGGARGYIGTLNSVANDGAVLFAEVFYDKVFEFNIIDAVNIARQKVSDELAETTHIFWGLHFSTLNNQDTVQSNRRNVIAHLGEQLARWQTKLYRNEGSADLVKGHISDTSWLFRNVLSSDEAGHVPLTPKSNKN